MIAVNFDVATIVLKELEELRKNRYILSTMASFPLIFSIAIPLIYLLTIPMNLTKSDVAMLFGHVPDFEALSPRQIVVYFLVQSNLPFYLLMPGLMPTLISSYSMVGEKKNGTLEPLLATPVSSQDILFGKTMAAVIPAVLITWISFLIYAILIDAATFNSFGYILLPNGIWLVAVFITAPLLAILSVYATVLVSSRMTDVRASQQVSAVIVVPIMAVFVLQLFGMITLDTLTLVVVSIGLLIVDVVLIRAGTALFKREEILTKWG
ncbi:putative ABC-type transport system, permease component [Methanocella arvoryzae MRE50]|uniref:ABC-type transport system, permease component n=1 Tax=Methanocella arvoryzae (strain DSM 22066 / NBRC 105507 / MRE50) TaxID=351160 RepID=Q0W8T3_METAR|nr:putative ABC-type transport system, permease component [Methanocella arvoryzae MRE50]